jgi:hypothetical protein
MSDRVPTVWGMFVGVRGSQLEVFNSKQGPFPPEEETNGYVAMGWPAVGDMDMYSGDYEDFARKFRMVYSWGQDSERVLSTKANMLWNFAFSMKEGDWIISPCSSQNLVLVGEVIGSYKADFHGESGLYGRTGSDLKQDRPDYLHLREVRWKYVISQSDPRYGKLNRIGQLTLTRQQMSFDELLAILQS